MKKGLVLSHIKDNLPYISEVRKQRKSLQNIEISRCRNDEYIASL